MASRPRSRKSTDEQPAQPTPDEQSGSGGRRTQGERGKGADTGQGRYGQTGLGGKQERETDGQARYRRSGPDGSQQPNPKSNRGSGRADRDKS